MPDKPKVLMIAPWSPFPWDAGSRRIWTACRSLRDRYDFYLLSFFNPMAKYPSYGQDTANLNSNSRMAAQLQYENLYFKGIFQRVQTVLPSEEDVLELFEKIPLPKEIQRFYTHEMEDAITRIIEREKIDLVHMEYDLTAPYVREIKNQFPEIPCVLTHHDLGALSFFGSYFREMSSWRRFLRVRDWLRRVRLTKELCPLFDAIVTVSARDRERLKRLTSLESVYSVPTGVDLDHFSGNLKHAERRSDTLVYVGFYPHYPNEDAVLWFAKKILPLIWEKRPEVKFQIVGADPTAALRALSEKDNRIEVSGYVPDVKPYEAEAMAMVAPIRLGHGIKGKILEAFGVGTPVVATSCANEGVGAVPNENILIADSPQRFAKETLKLLENEALWNKLSANCRSFVEGSHSWTKRANEIDLIYRRALAQNEKNMSEAKR